MSSQQFDEVLNRLDSLQFEVGGYQESIQLLQDETISGIRPGCGVLGNAEEEQSLAFEPGKKDGEDGMDGVDPQKKDSNLNEKEDVEDEQRLACMSGEKDGGDRMDGADSQKEASSRNEEKDDAMNCGESTAESILCDDYIEGIPIWDYFGARGVDKIVRTLTSYLPLQS